MVFADREDAGRRLAARLGHLRGEPVVVLGLPRGGVPVAFQVAQAHGAARVVLAVPVAPPGWQAGIGCDADELVCVSTPAVFFAIGEHYANFPQVPDEEVLACLGRAGLGTLLFDLLTPGEELDRASVFDVGLLAGRLAEVTRWLRAQPAAEGAAVGYFGASTGAAAAL